jgi:hypothetical protein
MSQACACGLGRLPRASVLGLPSVADRRGLCPHDVLSRGAADCLVADSGVVGQDRTDRRSLGWCGQDRACVSLAYVVVMTRLNVSLT